MYLIITQFCCAVMARFIPHDQPIGRIAWQGNLFILVALCAAAVLFTYRMTPDLTMGGIQEPLIVGLFFLSAIGIATPATVAVRRCRIQVHQRHRSWMYTVVALLTFLVALFCRVADKGHLCFGDPFAHALWHVLMALAIFFAYLFLRSELVSFPSPAQHRQGDFGESEGIGATELTTLSEIMETSSDFDAEIPGPPEAQTSPTPLLKHESI